jgi:hypothetical protein
LSESVDFPSLLDMYRHVISVLLVCLCVCLCHGVHRQTNRHSRDISEIVPAHTLAYTLAEITHTRLRLAEITHTRLRFSIFMYLSVFLVLLVCVCVCLGHGVHRQTNRHSREIAEVVPARTRARVRSHMQKSLAHP